MNVTQRAMLYILRKKGKTISLFLVVFVIAVFLILCFGVLNGSKKLAREIRTSLGAVFYIRANTQVSMNDKGEMEVKENDIHITKQETEKIMGTGDIKYCNPINYGFAKSDAIAFIPGDKHTEENNMGKVTALRFSALAPDFAEETAVLTEGKHITDGDEGKILLSGQLAEANGLSVGDRVTLTHAKLGEAEGRYIDEIAVKTRYVQVEIAGIYERDEEDASGKPTAGIAANKIYASLDVLDGLKESETDVYTGEVDFYITDPSRLNAVTRNVLQLQSIDWTTHFIRTNDFQYSKIADRLASLGDLVKLLLAFGSAAGTAFLTLLLTMRMRGRMREAGILLAAGISKGRIMAGFLLEVWSVALIALVFSYLVSLPAADFLEHSLFGGLQPNLLRDEAIISGKNGISPIETILKPGLLETLLLYTCQIAVIMASTCVSSIMMIRLQPKEILSKMS